MPVFVLFSSDAMFDQRTIESCTEGVILVVLPLHYRERQSGNGCKPERDEECSQQWLPATCSRHCRWTLKGTEECKTDIHTL